MIAERDRRPLAQPTPERRARYNEPATRTWSYATLMSPIRLTERAHARIRTFLATKPSAVGVRFGVKKTGCSGYGYVIDLADAVAAGDQVFEQDGVRIVVDADSLDFVQGTEIDFAQQGLGSAFVFDNPNVKGECGCGESFTVA